MQDDIRERGEGEPACKELKLAIIIGSRRDEALNAAAKFVLERSKTLGGEFRIWHSRSTGSPLSRIEDIGATGGRLDKDPQTVRERNFNSLLKACQDCQGRITELVIFHHGDPVDEAVVGRRLRQIFRGIRVPVCRVVWWACNAEVSLDVREGAWTDSLMKELGANARCRPCGCDHPIELIWPTAGKCYLKPDGTGFVPQTNDGKVNRARWGYPQADGSLGARPDPANPQPTRNPPDRDPDYGQPTGAGTGEVLGVPVTRNP